MEIECPLCGEEFESYWDYCAHVIGEYKVEERLWESINP